MKKTAYRMEETKDFLEIIRNNNKVIEELKEELEIEYTNYSDFKIVYEATKEKRRKLEKEIKILECENEIITLACNYKAEDLRNNLYVGVLKGLKELKLLGKNITELRSKKVKKYLIENNYINENNYITLYVDFSGYVNCKVMLKNACYNDGIEIFFSPDRIDFIEKMELKEIKNNEYYLAIARNYLNKINELKNEIASFNEKITNNLKELESESEYYSTKYIYNNCNINLYR